MQFWHPLMFEPMDQLAETAKILEGCGFEGVGLADHLVLPYAFGSVHPSGENPFTPESLFPDTFTTIAALAMVTTRLRLLSYLCVVPMRDPFTVAKQVATAATLSGDRVVFGAGAGWLREEFDVLGQPFDRRGARFDEALEVIRDFVDDGRAEHHGQHFDFPASAMFPVPAMRVPFWIGGKSPAALRRAVRHDGWLGMNYPMEEIEALLAELAEARRDAGPSDAPFEVFVIADAEPSLDLYRQLEAWGVTSTMGMSWMPGDPSAATLDAKRAAAESFARRFIEPLAS